MGDFPSRGSQASANATYFTSLLTNQGMPRRAAVLCMFLWCGTALALRIVPGERASSPSIDELNGKWVRPGTEARPVVLNGAAKEWPAMKWNLDDLKTKCGSRALEQTCQGDSQVLRTYDKNATGKMWGGMQMIWMKMSKDFPVIKSNYYGGDVPWHEFFSAQRCNISHTSLFDNMTPAQSVESLRLMGESMTPEQEQEIAEEQANLHNEHGDEDDHLSAADLQAAKSADTFTKGFLDDDDASELDDDRHPDDNEFMAEDL